MGPETQEEVEIGGLDNVVLEGAGSGHWASRDLWSLGILCLSTGGVGTVL